MKPSPRPSLIRGRLVRIVRRGLRRNSVESDVPAVEAIDLAVVAADVPANIAGIVRIVATVAKVGGPVAGVRSKARRRSSLKS
jgi:hypothetical protein